VEYSAVTNHDRELLDSYLDDLKKIKLSDYNTNEQLAYWINLYNALVIQVVLNHMPIESIRDVKLTGVFVAGPWKAKLIQIDGITLSLDEIEHEIVRPIWNDPRVHYAFNWGAIGSPNLQREPFRGKSLNRQLDNAAKAYVNSPRGVTALAEEDEDEYDLILSSIYDWYDEDFGDSEEAMITHLKKYAEPSLLEKLKKFDDVEGYEYNWKLNGR
jgi:hypothetical protein